MKDRSYAMLCGLLTGMVGSAQQRPIQGFLPDRGQLHDQAYHALADVRYVWPSASGISVAVRGDGFSYDTRVRRADGSAIDFHRIELRFLGGDRDPLITAEEALPGTFNFYNPVTAVAGITGVPHYARLVMHDVYDGIDVVCLAGEAFEYEFVVHPGADIDQVRMSYEGCAGITLTERGVCFPLSTFPLTESIPASWSLPSCAMVIARYRMLERSAKGIVVGLRIDGAQALAADATVVIDPVLVRDWGSYFGGEEVDAGLATDVDKLGKVYVAGSTRSLITWVTTGDFQGTFAGGNSDAYLAKFASHGSCFWSTYYGGTGEEEARAVCVDGHFDICLAGVTNSTDLFGTGNAVQDSLAGGSDMFIAKFDSAGVRIWGTYWGGSGQDSAFACTADDAGHVFIAGSTTSGTMQVLDTVPAAFPYTGGTDAFVVALQDSGTVAWATWYGGADDDAANGLALDSAGDLALVGTTRSPSGIATAGVEQEQLAGEQDAFVLKFDTAGVRTWGRYFGGTAEEEASDVVCVDGLIYFTGSTRSSGLPGTGSAYDGSLSGTSDGFLARLGSDGWTAWCTYVGGDSTETLAGIDRDRHGALYVVGTTTSVNTDSCMAASGSHQGSPGGLRDAFVQKFDPEGQRVWGSYYGGEADDEGRDIGVYGYTLAFITGTTSSPDGMAVDGLYDEFMGGGSDAFVARLVQEESTPCVGICNGGGGGGGGSGGGNGSEQPVDAIYICLGDTVMLTLSGGALGIGAEWMWYNGSCGDPPDFIGTGDTLIIAPVTSTTVFVRAESALNTTTCGHVNIIVEAYAQGSASAESPVCAGQPVQLHASGGDVYAWQNVDSTFASLEDPLLPPIDTAGTYLFSVFISSPHGCGDTSQVYVHVLPLPGASISATAITCNGAEDGSAIISAQDSLDQIAWTSLGASTALVEGLAPGSYPVTITGTNGCASQLFAEVASVPPLIGSVQVTTATCGASNGTATVLFNADTTGIMVFWNQGPAGMNVNGTLPPGSGSVGVSTMNGCADSAVFMIPDMGSFTVAILPDTIPIPNNGSTPIEVFVSPADMPVAFIWSPDTSLSCATCAEVIATPPFHQTYVVVAVNDPGCTATDSVFVLLDQRMAEFFLPDVFSPNGDGLNDELCVFGDVSEMHLEVFDSWGARMFESFERGQCWNGTFLGKPVNGGTYFFKVLAVMADGSRTQRSGEVRARP